MKTLKKYSVYIINVLLVVIIFLMHCYIANIFPFSSRALGLSDGLAQFKPMIYDLFTKIKLGILGTYSFNNGLGNPTLFNCLYYISSPLNFICLFFNSGNSMYFALVLLKLIITSINITIYAQSKTDNKVAIIIASLSYCFCGWFLIYYYYLSFVDIFMMFPLFQYGLEKLLNEGKNKVYIFALSYMIIANFYLCFPVCIYTIVYFVMYRLFYKQDTYKDKIKSFVNISKATIIVFLLTFFWLFLLVDTYKKISLTFDSTHFNDYFITFKGLIQSLYYGQEDIMLMNYGETFPNICCNTLILISLVFYFLNSKINTRERIFSLIALLLCVNVFVVAKLDFVMNFFHEIRGLTYRYCFIMCFLEIMLFLRNAQTFDIKDKISIRQIIIAMLLVISLSVFCYQDFYDLSYLQLFIMIPAFLVLIFLYDNNIVIKGLLVLLISIQTVVIFSFPRQISEIEEELIDVPYNKEDDTYRSYIGLNRNYCYRNNIGSLNVRQNCNLYFNGKVIDVLSSMTYSDVIYDLKNLGENGMFNTTLNHLKRNEFVNMIFNIEGTHHLEKIYSVNKDILNVKIKQKLIADNQDSIIKAMTGLDTIFNKKTITLDENNSSNDLYFIGEPYYYFDSYDKEGNKKNTIGTNPYILQKVTKYNKEIVYYTYSKEKIEKAYDILKKNQINYTHYEDSRIEGTINVDKNQIIFTSIPYDTNWDIYIDGIKIKPTKVFNSLIGIETTPGKHKLKMEYKYKWYYIIPFLISIVSFLTIIICYLKRKNIVK